MRRTTSFRLPQDLLERLEAYARAQGLDRTEVVERALRAYLDGAEGEEKALLREVLARLEALEREVRRPWWRRILGVKLGG